MFYIRKFTDFQKWLNVLLRLPVHLSVSIEQIGSNWTNFKRVWYFKNFPQVANKNSCLVKIWQRATCTLSTTIYLCQRFAEFELEIRFTNEFIKNIQFKQILCKQLFAWGGLGKYNTAKYRTHGNIIRSMRFIFSLHKAGNTHSVYVKIFHFKNSYKNTPQYYDYTCIICYDDVCLFLQIVSLIYVFQ